MSPPLKNWRVIWEVIRHNERESRKRLNCCTAVSFSSKSGTLNPALYELYILMSQLDHSQTLILGKNLVVI